MRTTKCFCSSADSSSSAPQTLCTVSNDDGNGATSVICNPASRLDDTPFSCDDERNKNATAIQTNVHGTTNRAKRRLYKSFASSDNTSLIRFEFRL